MTLKWTAVVVATVAVTLCATTNIVVETLTTDGVPVVVDILALAGASVAIVVAVLAEFYHRLTARITALSDFLVARLAELDAHTGDRNTGFVEGYLLGHAQDGKVVPLSPRAAGRRHVGNPAD